MSNNALQRVVVRTESNAADRVHAPVPTGLPVRDCPVCLGRQLRIRGHNLTQCPRCSHVFQSDLAVTAVYDSVYAHQYDNRPHLEMSRLRWEFIQQALQLPADSRVLDVGYGNGSFLKHVQSDGMRIFGIDLHGEDFGVPEVDYGTEQEFDLICFFDSLEHFGTFERPLSLRTRYAVVSIPNAPDFLLTGPQAWRHYKPGEHLHYFAPASLDRLMARWGMRRLASGHPEDAIRGKLTVGDRTLDNIYTAIYGCESGRSPT